ncbi:polysaccharide deacetylase, putative, pda4C [Cellvibrio japonicus Ueda107]|uniref:Polysaccharide deacetylase, putative, pda4C n=1 Tax=Cellvibrio japonicus (strain Ueda107) TaxID=498211 RepID=B3PFB4_CELJU|nr:polysaccharide deacetylase, putative, pda4C [Cellvibrio japonicus Ueda107]
MEDYYHVAAFAKVIKPSEWDQWPSRVEANTQRLLQVFSDHGITITFFILGWVAERYPQLVRDIQTQGHEIASHGYSHQLIYRQDPQTFRRETEKSKQLLEDITQAPITGYRAASYSITRSSLWALDILAELGFTWDSSIFPTRHDNYGIPGSPEEPYRIITRSGASLIEFPLTTAKVWGQSIPAAGGGYFRQYPYALSRWLFQRASDNQSKPQIFYLHPWEIDPEQPRVPNASWFSNFRHYTNLKRCLPRLERMIQDFPFGTMSKSLGSTRVERELHVTELAQQPLTE